MPAARPGRRPVPGVMDVFIDFFCFGGVWVSMVIDWFFGGGWGVWVRGLYVQGGWAWTGLALVVV